MAEHTVESTPDRVRSGFLGPTPLSAAGVASSDVVRYPDTGAHWGNEAVYGMTFAERVDGITRSLAPFRGLAGDEAAGDDPASAILAGPSGGRPGNAAE